VSWGLPIVSFGILRCSAVFRHTRCGCASSAECTVQECPDAELETTVHFRKTQRRKRRRDVNGHTVNCTK